MQQTTSRAGLGSVTRAVNVLFRSKADTTLKAGMGGNRTLARTVLVLPLRRECLVQAHLETQIPSQDPRCHEPHER
jgi:hypothetical protein